jgi:uncharacterized protein YjdB
MNSKPFIMIALIGVLLASAVPMGLSSADESPFSEIGASYDGERVYISGQATSGQTFNLLTFDICDPAGNFISTGYSVPSNDGSFSLIIYVGELDEANGYAVKVSASRVNATTQYATVYFDVASVTGVSLDNDRLELLVGSSFTLVATVIPSNVADASVSWASSDDQVVSVDQDGNLIAKSVGSAAIVITTVDGGYTATCYVTVYNGDVDVTGVSLDRTSAVIKVGQSIVLSAAVMPSDGSDQSVSWSSSDSSVVSVDDNGKITAVSKGTAIITVTTSDGGYSDECRVSVKDMSVHVSGVVVSDTSLKMDAGSSTNLSATVEPSNADNTYVVWSSSNESVATVSSSGRVTAVSAGTAVITVTTEDGGYTAKCTVTVGDAASSFSLDASSILLKVGDTSSIGYDSTPSTANVAWSSGRVSVATVDSSGRVTAVSAGTAVITAYCGAFTAKCTVTVVDGSGGISVIASGSDGSYSVTIPSYTLDGISGGALTVSSGAGDIVLSSDVMKKLSSMDGDLTLSIRQVDIGELTATQREAVGDGLVISLVALVGSASVHELGGSVTVTVPYAIESDENPNGIQVHYLTDSGTMESVDCTYDAASGTVSFTVDHFSYYVLTYEEGSSATDSGNAIYIAIAIVVLLLIVLFAAYYLTRRGNKTA